MKYKKFVIYGIAYYVYEATAIAECDEGDESKRQNVLLVIDTNGTEVDRHVVFGYDMPETEDDFNAICEDANAWEPADDNVRCPELGDGERPWEKYFWNA